MKHELQNILSGKSQVEFGATIQAATRYFRRSKSTSKTFESSKSIKSEEATLIRLRYRINPFFLF
jgi:hypothetical protein